MSIRYSEAEFVEQPTYYDISGMAATKTNADYWFWYNNRIHYHRFWELEFIISGSGSYEINNVSYPIKRGMLFITTPADYHTYSLSENESFQMFCVQFRSERLSELLISHLYSCTEPIAVDFDDAMFDEINSELERLTDEFSGKRPMYELEMRNIIESICIRVVRRIEMQKHGSAGDSAIRSAIIYAKNHYHEHITLSDAAGLSGLSEAYFSHVFSTVMGMGFSVYLRQIRLDAAANLLKSTNLSVKEICYMTGFGNRNYFTEAFREHFGSNPRDYRADYLASVSMSLSELGHDPIVAVGP